MSRFALALFAALVTLALACSPGRAEPRETAATSLFRKVVTQPTGKNGFEEFLLAAEAADRSRPWKKVEANGGTLQEKREVLADPDVRRALLLLDRGLTKPVRQPRARITFAASFPEFAGFRSLARLLSLREYVLFADGNTADAIRGAGTFLRFSQALPSDTLISGLVKVSMSGMAVQAVAARLDQLSARDCEQLFALCTECLKAPEPTADTLMGERQSMRDSLAEWSAQVKKNEGKPRPGDLDLEDEETAPLQRALADGPEALDRMLAEVVRKADAFYQRVFDELRKPPWERKIVEFDAREDGSPSGVLIGMLMPTLAKVDQAFVRDQARIRLLAVHCAVRRYRWEHDHLPRSLDELRLGDLAIDPFTGSPLKYEVTGSRYRVSSAGPNAAEDDEKAVDGRLPVSIGPD